MQKKWGGSEAGGAAENAHERIVDTGRCQSPVSARKPLHFVPMTFPAPLVLGEDRRRNVSEVILEPSETSLNLTSEEQ